MDGLVTGSDGRARCWWGCSAPDYVAYHDHEWGRPVADDRRLFEKICLEGFQSGLSWLTILRKRDNFRAAFHGFDYERVAAMGPADVERLLQDRGIVRHRRKIEATLQNARAACAVAERYGSLAAFVWQFEPPPGERPVHLDRAALTALSSTPTSRRLAKALKGLGWTFVGPTTAYAFMQAMGLVDDHLEGCAVRPEAEADRRAFRPPAPSSGPRPPAAPGA